MSQTAATSTPRPWVSVVVPAYNHARFLRDAILSVDAQTFRDVELVVVDDGSTDDTVEEVGRLPPLTVPFRLIRQPHSGAAAALNAGIAEARGEFIAWLSSDDWFVPEKLQCQVDYMTAHPEIALLYTDVYVDDELTGRTYLAPHAAFDDHATMVRELFRYCFINGSTTLVKRADILAVGGFDPDLPQAHDWDLWLRLSRDSLFGHIALPLIHYRWHGGNLSLRDDAYAYHARVLDKARRWFREAGIEPPG